MAYLSLPDAALNLVAAFEGFRAEPYRCPAGVWTVGYGFTRRPDGSRVESDDPPTTETFARVRLRRELLKTGRVVCRLVVCPLTSNQFGALTSFTYNVGSGNFKASTLRQKLNRGDYAGACLEFPKWRRAGGKILPGLVRRRTAEQRLFEA